MGSHKNPRKRKSPEERFWLKVDRKGPDGCWEWTASKCGSKREYGQFWDGANCVMSHRYSYTLHKGPIPKGFCICHSCDNPCCVNPNHLWLGTIKENLRDMYRKQRDRGQKKTHCKRGHPLSGENLLINFKGNRNCKICTRRSAKLYKRRMRKKLKDDLRQT